jgi:mono/diheme cytochrome c family protein
MFKRIVNVVEVLAVVAAAVFLVLLFTNEPDSGGGGGRGGNASPGAALFASNCARCHGGDGGGGLGPQLSDGKVVNDLTEAEEIRVVTNGRSGMPSFGDALSPEEIQQVMAYTRTL